MQDNLINLVAPAPAANMAAGGSAGVSGGGKRDFADALKFHVGQKFDLRNQAKDESRNERAEKPHDHDLSETRRNATDRAEDSAQRISHKHPVRAEKNEPEDAPRNVSHDSQNPISAVATADATVTRDATPVEPTDTDNLALLALQAGIPPTDTQTDPLQPKTLPLLPPQAEVDPNLLVADAPADDSADAPPQPFFDTASVTPDTDATLRAHLPENLAALLAQVKTDEGKPLPPGVTQEHHDANGKSARPESVAEALARIAGNAEPAPVRPQEIIPQAKAEKAQSVLDLVKDTLTKNTTVNITHAAAHRPTDQIIVPGLAEEKTPAEILSALKPVIDIASRAQIATAITASAFTASSDDFGADQDTLGNSQNTPAGQPLPAHAEAKSIHTENTFAKLLNSTQHTSAAEQVTVQIKNIAATGMNRIRIQLDPAELGKVEVQMHIGGDGKTTLSIAADNRNTLDMLQREVKQLEQALRDVGLKTDAGSLSFNLRGEQGQQQFARQPGSYTQVAQPDQEEIDYYDAATSVYRMNVREGVDIRV